jgi:glycosyltransferase involved in cell wall biosynthesis
MTADDSSQHVVASDALNLSVIMPVYNESDSIKNTITELVEVLDSTKANFEIIAVDDGSQDNSLVFLRDLCEVETRLKVIVLRANYGQTAAIAAGIMEASGSIIVLIDADGQNDPAEIPRLLQLIEDGADCVAGWRKSRQDSISRRIPSRAANMLISWATGVKLNDYGCSLKAFRAEVIKDVMLIGEMHRMIPILVKQNGGSIVEVVVNHRPRTAGVSKYGLARTPRVIADLLVARFLLLSASKPMYLFGKFSFLGVVTALVAGAAAIYFKLTGTRDFVETPLPLLGLFSLMFASLAFLSGLLAELLVRINFQQAGPPYKIRMKIGF